ncbi:uncharacterized protein Dwil_GK24699 [Drosophila willistoni]|uniref:RNA polymerase II assembly factor Rtp1 C-terminal domain-containing protein n=1 Tax=Drosophila willistoni TaxID=7260 RepID=B4MZQ4_DROWI|nr:transport and Golgi organization protein 6 [Drosophila willistoni]EDW77839.1 uncharacterized protein Dwil_GK24699 [Drosophila willistoni]
MTNTLNYFNLLGSLKFEHALKKENSAEPILSSGLQTNLETLEQFITLDINQQLQELCSQYKLPADQAECIKLQGQPQYSYIVRLSYVLHLIITNTKFDSDAKEDLISVAHLKLCIQAVQELSYYALRCQLSKDFYKISFPRATYPEKSPNRELLWLSVQLFRQLMHVRQFHIADSMHMVQRDLLSAILSLDEDQPDLSIANLSKADFISLLLLLKATGQMEPHRDKIVHHTLIRQLNSPHGLESLIESLRQQSQNDNPNVLAEIVANTIIRSCRSQQNQKMKIFEAFEFCSKCLKQDMDDFEVGSLTLRRLYDQNVENQSKIKDIMAKQWEILISPKDLLTGVILQEHDELCHLIRMWYHIFCSSTVACLPSSLLISYLPLLLRLYDSLPLQLNERKQISALIIRCLDNRETREELPDLLRKLFNWDIIESKESNWLNLHPRILLVPALDATKIVVKMGPTNPDDHHSKRNLIKILGEILLTNSNHSLTCNAFLALLSHLGDLLKDKASSGIDFISTEEELELFLYATYNSKLELLLLLNQMVAHKPLRSQIALNGKEFVKLIEKLLQQRLDLQSKDSDDQILLLILSLLQEVLDKSEDLLIAGHFKRLQEQLQQVKMQSSNLLIQQSVETLLSQLQGIWSPTETYKSEAFNRARSLIEEKESHLQVYGIQLLLKLLHQKDPTTMTKGHLIIALALATLKDKESYTFLNCVRLFVVLTHTMEAEVMDKLSDEYLSESSDLDYRLVVGEAILKSAQELGPLCYRYKAELLNGFMLGCRSHQPEFRMSSFANLAQLCRILAYQVHNFFQELLQLINAELNLTDGYLPSKRAAVLVLAELLNGMENLLDYQEMLLPIYRLLKAIEAEESGDPQMRQHASNGLKILNEKCRDLIKSVIDQQSLVKEIQILGINDKPKTGKKSILELN